MAQSTRYIERAKRYRSCPCCRKCMEYLFQAYGPTCQCMQSMDGVLRAVIAFICRRSGTVPKGLSRVTGVSGLGLELQQTCISVTSKYLRERRPVVKSFVQAYAEALHRFLTDRDFSLQVMKKYLRVNEKELLDDAYDFYSPRVQKIPYPTLKGIRVILDEMAERRPQARKAAPEIFVDLSLLQEIDQSGFFKQFWKNYSKI